ncbi:hypothetical protein MOBT1_002457 [Malassezia obtusa]|uniref:Uncharacterized protein n=1 Tax=Malassezia obtusa TaxID=76774 RepID=A0AAF0E613_9BASI|nr:hypothetical protein MOBT1_002457 [Malassezia obtusa]
MARGARHAAALRATLAGLDEGAASRRMPALTALAFRIPQKFGEKRLCIVYANPQLAVDVAPPAQGEAPCVQVQFANMPERTIVLGEKPASEIVQELLTMGRFAHERR